MLGQWQSQSSHGLPRKRNPINPKKIAAIVAAGAAIAVLGPFALSEIARFALWLNPPKMVAAIQKVPETYPQGTSRFTMGVIKWVVPNAYLAGMGDAIYPECMRMRKEDKVPSCGFDKTVDRVFSYAMAWPSLEPKTKENREMFTVPNSSYINVLVKEIKNKDYIDDPDPFHREMIRVISNWDKERTYKDLDAKDVGYGFRHMWIEGTKHIINGYVASTPDKNIFIQYNNDNKIVSYTYCSTNTPGKTCRFSIQYKNISLGGHFAIKQEEGKMFLIQLSSILKSILDKTQSFERKDDSP